MNVPAAWQIAHGSPATVVAVIDSGVDIAHEDLPPSAIWSNPLETAGEAGVDDDGNGYVDDLHGWDWVDGDGTPQDDYGHGTHVAGHHRRGHGQRRGRERRRPWPGGQRPARCWTIWARAVSDVIDVLAYAGRQGVRIVNLSLVIQEDTPALHDALRWAHDQDMLAPPRRATCGGDSVACGVC
ncbi:MAG: S8 family serine peptidase [Caldilineaceae bacterium]